MRWVLLKSYDDFRQGSGDEPRLRSDSLTNPQQVPRMAGRNEFEMRLGGGDECECQGA